MHNLRHMEYSPLIFREIAITASPATIDPFQLSLDRFSANAFGRQFVTRAGRLRLIRQITETFAASKDGLAHVPEKPPIAWADVTGEDPIEFTLAVYAPHRAAGMSLQALKQVDPKAHKAFTTRCYLLRMSAKQTFEFQGP